MFLLKKKKRERERKSQSATYLPPYLFKLGYNAIYFFFFFFETKCYLLFRVG
jgi:hypothetical protein